MSARYGALLSVAALLTVASRAEAQHPLATLPFDDPAYEVLDGLVRTGCSPARVSVFRPYFVRDVRTALAAPDSNAR